MMETVQAMKRNYDRTLRNGKEKIDGKLRQKGERSAETEKNRPYIERDWITITVDEIARAVDVSARGSSAASFASRLLNIFKECTIQIFWEFCRR